MSGLSQSKLILPLNMSSPVHTPNNDEPELKKAKTEECIHVLLVESDDDGMDIRMFKLNVSSIKIRGKEYTKKHLCVEIDIGDGYSKEMPPEYVLVYNLQNEELHDVNFTSVQELEQHEQQEWPHYDHLIAVKCAC
jgi:hypothetical protein